MNEAIAAIKQGKTKYGSAAGEKKLREKIAETYKTKSEQVIITPGSKWAIFSIMTLYLKKGDGIILPSPHWTAYEEIAKLLGAKIKFLKTELEKEWQIEPEKLKSLIDRNTKLIILNNPNNPTSKVIDENTIEEIVDIANKKGIKILADESYADISFKKVKSILDFSGEHFYVNSFSKTFAMTGWRLGFAIVPTNFAKEMIRLNQITSLVFLHLFRKQGLKRLNLKKEYQKRCEKFIKKELILL